MIRRIIRIDEQKCNGCGKCASACHEGAIGMVNGKARLMREDYCDGLGDCLPACPMDAIRFEEREAPAYDAEAVRRAMEKKKALEQSAAPIPGMLENWPVQIRLAPVNSPAFEGADLLIAADCTAYAYGSFHADFIRGRTVLIGCPKLDAVDYSRKLSQIFTLNDIRSITVTRMVVPCCGGLEFAVKRALEESGKDIPLRVATVTPDGNIIEND